MPTELPPEHGMGDAPAETVALGVEAVKKMDRDILESFVRRTWRTWSAESLRPLLEAVEARRAELGRQA